MIGLQFICETYGMEYKTLAEKLGVTPQYVNAWLRGKRNIPKERIQQLSEIFPNVPTECFQKELTKSEKMLIQENYFRENDVFEEVEYSFTDDDGVERWATQTVSENEPIIRILQDEYEKQILIERYEQLINSTEGGGYGEYGSRKMIEKCLELLETHNGKHIEFFQMVFYYLHNENQWGVDPFFAASKKQEVMYKEFNGFLLKYGIID